MHPSRRLVRPWAVVALLGVASPLVAQTPVTLLGYRTAAPVSWVPGKPTSSMRLAQFTIGGSDPARASNVVVYFFGEGSGGSVEENLARWKEQFSTPDGSPVYAKVAKEAGAPFPTTIAEYRGTYARGVGASDPSNAKPAQTLIAAVVETPRGTLFVQLYGPSTQVAEQRRALVTFVRQLR
jgi:hypothetical protein